MPLYGPAQGIQMAASATTFSTDTVVLSASNGVGLSVNGSTIILSGPAQSVWGNLSGVGAWTLINLSASTKSLFVFPLNPAGAFPINITASTARMLMSIGETTTATNMAAMTISVGLGIYVISGSGSAATLSLLNSASWSFGSGGTMASTAFSNSVSGNRWMTIHSSAWSSAPAFSEGGQYYGAVFLSSAGPAIQTLALYGASVMSTMNLAGAVGAASVSNASVGIPYYAGVFSVTTGAFPSSIHVSALNKQVAMANFIPVIEFDMLNASH